MNSLLSLDDTLNSYYLKMGLAPEPTTPGHALFRYGSTVIVVSTFSDELDNSNTTDVYCRIASIVLDQVEPSLELLQMILRLNTEVLFGAFLLFEDNVLSFSATLFANTLNFATFERTLTYVARISNEFDEEFQLLGQGQRGIELYSSK